MNNYTKITIQDIEIAESFFENDKHLDEFLANVCRYYSGKTITIKTKIVAKYFETYKKTMDRVVLARDYGKNGGIKKAENESLIKDTLLGGVLDTPLPKLIEVNTKEIEEKINKEKEIENQVSEIYSLYPTTCKVSKRTTSKNSKDKAKIKSILKTKSLEDIKTIIEKYLSNCELSKTYLKNFGTFLNNLPEVEEIKDIGVTDDTMVFYTDEDSFNPESTQKVRKAMFDKYLKEGKKVKFIRYDGI